MLAILSSIVYQVKIDSLIAMLLLVGILESCISSINVILLQKKHKIGCFITNMIHIYLWWYLISSLVEKIGEGNVGWYVGSYAIGYGWGDIVALDFMAYLERLAKTHGKKFKILKRKWFKKAKRKK